MTREQTEVLNYECFMRQRFCNSESWISTANDSEEILATTLDHELIANLLKSLWNYIMVFIFKQREIKIYGDNFIRNLMKLSVYLEKRCIEFRYEKICRYKRHN